MRPLYAKLIVIFTFLSFFSGSLNAHVLQSDTIKGKSLFAKVWNYFSRSNEGRSDKKFDFSIIGAPRYSSDKKFGVAALAAGLYSTDRSDTTLMKSDISLVGDLSTVGYRKIELYGNNIFPHDRFRLIYDAEFYTFPSYTWGIGYDMCNEDKNKTELKRHQVNVKASFLIHLTDNFFIGPTFAYNYIDCDNPDNPEILPDFDRVTSNVGIGFTAVYDTRDVITFPRKGCLLSGTQTFRPQCIGNSHAFSTTELTACFYSQVWKGAVLAGDVNGMLNFGDVPWGLMAQLGGSNSMRGYYEGRYRDKHKLECQLELRQHLWGRNGIVAWVGAGTVFDKFSAIDGNKILPNCGIGYRWEFKKNVNLRFDCGLGKAGQSGVMFSVNEAF